MLLLIMTLYALYDSQTSFPTFAGPDRGSPSLRAIPCRYCNHAQKDNSVLRAVPPWTFVGAWSPLLGTVLHLGMRSTCRDYESCA